MLFDNRFFPSYFTKGAPPTALARTMPVAAESGGDWWCEWYDPLCLTQGHGADGGEWVRYDRQDQVDEDWWYSSEVVPKPAFDETTQDIYGNGNGGSQDAPTNGGTGGASGSGGSSGSAQVSNPLLFAQAPTEQTAQIPWKSIAGGAAVFAALFFLTKGAK